MAENESKIQADSGQGRSPVSPMFAIDEAIKRAKMLYDKDKRAWTTFENVAKHIGLTGTKRGGRTGRAVSALRQYGLLDENKGQYRISATAFKIFELPESDPEREKLIRVAALTPSIVKKVLEHHNWELPSDETLRAYLIFQLKFTPDNATDFIKVVRRTSELVKAGGEDYNAGEPSEGDDTPPPGETPRMQQQQQQQPPPLGGKTPPLTPPKPPAGQRTYHLYLSPETEGVLYAPSVMTRTEYEILKSQIDNSLKVILAASVVPDPQGFPRSATWKNADHDQPVIVIGELGGGTDGQRYFKVLESNTGIPENELQFEDTQAKGAA
jgi:hypothetical protein